MELEDWDRKYKANDTPWDIGEPDDEIVRLVTKRGAETGKALDLGCGTGNDAIYLAKKGFEVIGVDLSPFAIQTAEKQAKREKVDSRCRFHNGDILDLSFLEKGAFDLVFNRTCFGGFDQSQRRTFKDNVRSLLARNGKFLLLELSDADTTAGKGTVSERELRATFEPDFVITHLELTTLKHRGHSHKAWKMLAHKK